MMVHSHRRTSHRRWHSLGLQSERKLEEKLFRVPVPISPELALGLFNLPARHLKCNRLIWLGSEQQVLPLAVWRFDLLFVGGHEPMTRHDVVLNLRVVDLEQKTLLSASRIPLLGDSIAGTSDFHKLLGLHAGFIRSQALRRFLSLLGGTTSEIRLMLLALRVGQVAAFVVVQGQTEFAFIGAQMVLHEIWILVQVNRLQGELPETLPTVSIGFGP